MTLELPADTVVLGQIRLGESPDGGVVYWYDLDGRIGPNTYAAKAFTIWDGLTRRRTNGAVILVAWQPPSGRPDGSHERVIRFVQALLPITRQYIPS
jgi:EpsI family protein